MSQDQNLTMVAAERDAVMLRVDYPERSSRIFALLGIFGIKYIMVVPHWIVMFFVTIAVSLVIYVSYWIVLIFGRYPKGLFNFVVSAERWNIRITSWLFGWSDSYPPFGQRETVDYQVLYPERCSRLWSFLGVFFFIKLILLIPHMLVLSVLSTAALLANYFGYWAVLVLGRYPRGMFEFGVGISRLNARSYAWFYGLTDSYPRFGGID